MAKLYAELYSDKGGRVIGKGGDDFITVKIFNGNKMTCSLDYCLSKNQMHVSDESDELQINFDGYVI